MWAGPGVGKTTLLGGMPGLLEQKLRSLETSVSLPAENFGNPFVDNAVDSYYTGIDNIRPRLSVMVLFTFEDSVIFTTLLLKEYKELQNALRFGCAVYVDFSSGDGLTAWDAQQVTGASCALGRRIVARVFQGCSTQYQNVSPGVDPSIFTLDNVLRQVAVILHEKVRFRKHAFFF